MAQKRTAVFNEAFQTVWLTPQNPHWFLLQQWRISSRRKGTQKSQTMPNVSLFSHWCLQFCNKKRGKCLNTAVPTSLKKWAFCQVFGFKSTGNKCLVTLSVFLGPLYQMTNFMGHCLSDAMLFKRYLIGTKRAEPPLRQHSSQIRFVANKI